MSDDLGADFLRGYFGMAEMRQNRLNQQATAQQWAQDMQLKQQQYALSSKVADARIAADQSESDWRDAQTSHQTAIEKQNAANETAKNNLAAIGLIHSGAATQVQPGAQIPVPGMPGMNIPQGMTQPGVTRVGNQWLRAATPQESAQSAFTQKQAEEEQNNLQKISIAHKTVTDMASRYPKSNFAQDDDMQQDLFQHMVTGAPLRKEEDFNNMSTHMFTQYNKQRKVALAAGDNATVKQLDTEFGHDANALRKVNPNPQIPGLAEGIRTNYEKSDLQRQAEDASEIRIKSASSINPGDSASVINNKTNKVIADIDNERRQAGKPALHPKAVAGAMAVEEKGTNNPKADGPDWDAMRKARDAKKAQTTNPNQ